MHLPPKALGDCFKKLGGDNRLNESGIWGEFFFGL